MRSKKKKRNKKLVERRIRAPRRGGKTPRVKNPFLCLRLGEKIQDLFRKGSGETSVNQEEALTGNMVFKGAVWGKIRHVDMRGGEKTVLLINK